MKQSLQLRLGQNLTMTPQLQQAIRLLQLSTVELNVEVQQALESNMMLEPADDDGDSATELEFGTNSQSGETQQQDAVETPTETTELDTAAALSGEDQDIPSELAVDSAWEDIYDGASAYAAPAKDSDGMEFENQQRPDESLRERLLWQLNLLPLSETDRVIAMTIVDSINADGYLGCDLEDIRETISSGSELDIGLDEIEAVLHRVQRVDAPGLAARDLRECLMLQLEELEPSTPWLSEARRLVRDYLDLLGVRDYNQLMRRLKMGTEELQQVIALIQSLNPRPGSQIESPPTEYLVPDVFVRKVKSSWQVELNPESIPRLRVNPYYASMVRRADASADNLSMKAHLQEARWFIKSLQSRGETLLRVAAAIVERQQGFLEHGEEAMKPLVLHDISEALDVHESTISRVTTRKYMHTPRGIYELKYFFSSHVSTFVGGECSSTAIRAVIKKLIGCEDPRKPLSDSKIAKLLGEKGINVARRTVAKYRETMTIPPSNERKRLA
ncbi:MAG: RNA polymerase factor sigma-54 [Gammaproteobacteria bacterium]